MNQGAQRPTLLQLQSRLVSYSHRSNGINSLIRFSSEELYFSKISSQRKTL